MAPLQTFANQTPANLNQPSTGEGSTLTQPPPSSPQVQMPQDNNPSIYNTGGVMNSLFGVEAAHAQTPSAQQQPPVSTPPPQQLGPGMDPQFAQYWEKYQAQGVPPSVVLQLLASPQNKNMGVRIYAQNALDAPPDPTDPNFDPVQDKTKAINYLAYGNVYGKTGQPPQQAPIGIADHLKSYAESAWNFVNPLINSVGDMTTGLAQKYLFNEPNAPEAMNIPQNAGNSAKVATMAAGEALVPGMPLLQKAALTGAAWGGGEGLNQSIQNAAGTNPLSETQQLQSVAGNTAAGIAAPIASALGGAMVKPLLDPAMKVLGDSIDGLVEKVGLKPVMDFLGDHLGMMPAPYEDDAAYAKSVMAQPTNKEIGEARADPNAPIQKPGVISKGGLSPDAQDYALGKFARENIDGYDPNASPLKNRDPVAKDLINTSESLQSDLDNRASPLKRDTILQNLDQAKPFAMRGFPNDTTAESAWDGVVNVWKSVSEDFEENAGDTLRARQKFYSEAEKQFGQSIWEKGNPRAVAFREIGQVINQSIADADSTGVGAMDNPGAGADVLGRLKRVSTDYDLLHNLSTQGGQTKPFQSGLSKLWAQPLTKAAATVVGGAGAVEAAHKIAPAFVPGI